MKDLSEIGSKSEHTYIVDIKPPYVLVTLEVSISLFESKNA
jgi:hypothetical protein